MDEMYSTINFYDSLDAKYHDYLKPEIVSVSLIQTKEQVSLETVKVEIIDGFEKQTVSTTDLSFISDGSDEELFFKPSDPIQCNVKKFIDGLTPYSIINTTDLFTEEAAKKISNKYNIFGVDK